jgi:hypothetical protein
MLSLNVKDHLQAAIPNRQEVDEQNGTTQHGRWPHTSASIANATTR